MSQFRNLMMTKIGEGGILPAGYTECEYLSSNQNAYIDTGIIPKMPPMLKLDMMATSTLDVDYFGFIQNSFPSFIGNMRFYDNTTMSAWYRYGSTSSITPFGEHLHFVNVRHMLIASDTLVIDDDVVVSSLIPVDWSACTQSINIFRGRTIAGMRCYGAQVLLEGVVVWNGIPALDPNGRPCMYDTMSQQPFYNSGTGEFGYELK